MPDPIVTRAPGYVLDVPAEVTDVSRFEHLVAEGRLQLSRRRPSESARLLKEAEDLWRGPAYSDVRDEPFARAEARRLEELLLSAAEARIDARLTMGEHQALASELESLTSANPMRERLWSPAHAGALPRRPAGRGAARLPGPPRHPRGRVGHRAGPRRRLVGARHPHPGARAPLPGPSRARRRLGRLRTRGDVPSPPTASGCPASNGRARSSAASASRACCAPGGHRSATAGGASSSSTEIPASERRGWWSSSRAPWRRTGRWSCGGVATRTTWHPSSLWPKLSAATSRRSRPTGSHTCLTGSSRSSPGWWCACASTRRSLEEEGGDPESGRFRFFEAVTATLNELSADGTILLVVDNLHWADQPTLLLLRHILRSTEDGKLGVIGMYTDTEVPPDHPVRSMLADCRAAHPVETVHLRGLSPTAVEALARNWPKAPPDLVPQLCRLDRRQPALPRRAAAAVRGPRGRAGRREPHSRPDGPQPDRSHPRAGGPAGLAAPRGRDLPAASGRRGRPRVRGGHRGGGRRARSRPPARCLRPGRGVPPAPSHRRRVPRPLCLQPRPGTRRDLR